MPSNPTYKIISILFFLFMAVNLLIIDLKIFAPETFIRVSDLKSSATPSPASTNNQSFDSAQDKQQSSCPLSCVSLISDATKSAENNIGSPLQPTTNNQQSIILQSPREYFIPLGSGTTSKSDWDNLTATETIIDPSSYGTIKEAYVTYSLRNPTQNGQAEVRLYNVTDKYVVYGTEVVMKDVSSQTINTGKFALPQGAKLYRVQMRSTISYPAYLDNAKIKIVTQ